MANPVRIRSATHAEVADIVAIVDAAYRGEASRAGWTSEADLLDGQRVDAQMVRELITSPASELLVASIESVLVGTVVVEDEGDGGYIGMLAVRPGQQSSGIGHQLLAHAERRVRDVLGHDVARMCVIGQRAELIAWYEREGYRRTGETEPFPYGDERFGKPKRKDLYFSVLAKQLV